MPQPRCRQCHARPVWRHTHNDLHACKRCYHHVWNATRTRLRDYHAALGVLERGRIPATLAAYGTTAEEVAARLLHELEETTWHTGAKHEVPLLMTRCARLVRVHHAADERPTDRDAPA